MQPSFSYLLVQLNAVFQERLDISIYQNYDQMGILIRAIDNKIYEFNIANDDYLIQNLSTQNTISLSASISLAVFLSCILVLIYLLLIERFLKKRLIEVRMMLKLISLNIFSKSAKLKKYLVTTGSQKIKV